MAEVLKGIVDKARESIKDGIDLLLVIVGAGSATTIIDVVRSWLPEQTAGIADETLAAGVGFALFYFGDRIHPRVAPFGFGVFIASVGAWSSEFIAGFMGMLIKK